MIKYINFFILLIILCFTLYLCNLCKNKENYINSECPDEIDIGEEDSLCDYMKNKYDQPIECTYERDKESEFNPYYSLDNLINSVKSDSFKQIQFDNCDAYNN